MFSYECIHDPGMAITRTSVKFVSRFYIGSRARSPISTAVFSNRYASARPLNLSDQVNFKPAQLSNILMNRSHAWRNSRHESISDLQENYL